MPGNVPGNDIAGRDNGLTPASRYCPLNLALNTSLIYLASAIGSSYNFFASSLFTKESIKELVS